MAESNTTEIWAPQSSTPEDWSVVFTGSAAEGFAAGLATVVGGGAFSQSALIDGFAAGAAVVSGVGSSTAFATGTAAGSSTVSGVGNIGVVSGTGLAQGVAMVSGVFLGQNEGAGLAEGMAGALGVGASTAEATGSADGLATVMAAGAATASADGLVAAAAAVLGAGSATFAADGLAAGAATASAVGQDRNAIPAEISRTALIGSGVNGDSYTFLSVDLGAEDPGRYIAVLGASNAGSNLNWSVTLDGATADYSSGWLKSPTGNGQVGLFVFAKPTGLTGDIVLGGSGFSAMADITVYRLTNIASATPSDVNTSTGTAPSSTITIPDNGVALAQAVCAATTTISWTGLTDDFDTQTETCNFSAAFDAFATGGDTAIAANTGGVDAIAIFAAWMPDTGASAGEAAGTSAGAATALGAGAATASADGAAAGLAAVSAVGQDVNAIPAVVYDGVQGFLKHTGGPAGAADGAALTAVWAGTFNSDGSAMTLLDIPGTVPVKLSRTATNTIQFQGGTAGAVFSNVTAAVAASLGFCVIFASCRGTHSSLVVLHAAGTITGTNTAGAAATLDLTADWFLGADGGTSEFLDADVALWWAHPIWMDSADAEWREQFYDTTNDLLRDPGSDGSNPLGAVTQPLICHKTAAPSHQTNSGSGGDADVDGGVISENGTSPGSYSAALVNAFDLLLTAEAWWSADHSANTITSSAVETLSDRTGNAQDLTQATAGSRPALVTSVGIVGMDFDGSDDRLTIASPSASLMNNFNSGGTSVEVTEPDSDGGGDFGRIWEKDGSSGELAYWGFQTVNGVAVGFGFDHTTQDCTGSTDSDERFPVNVKRLTDFRYDKSAVSFSDLILGLDGTSRQGTTNGNLTVTTAPIGTGTDLSTGSFSLGGRVATPSRAFDGTIHEVAFWDSKFSDADIARVRTHMGRKYGVTLA